MQCGYSLTKSRKEIFNLHGAWNNPTIVRVS